MISDKEYKKLLKQFHKYLDLNFHSIHIDIFYLKTDVTSKILQDYFRH